MKLLLLCFFILANSSAIAADYEFHSLYEKDGFISERLLPFTVKSSLPGEFSIGSIEVYPPCYGMVDLHRTNLVLIYCTEASQTKFHVKIIKDGVPYKLSSPVFEVKQVALVSSTPKPDDGVKRSMGHRLFDVNCKKCHQSPYYIKPGINRTHLTNAFSGKPIRNGNTTDAMKDFNGFFHTSELDALVKYINEEL